MGVTYTEYCPRGHEMKRSDKFIDGHVVYRCVECGLYKLDETSEFVTSGTNDEIRANLLGVLEARQRYADMVQSDIDDPRWSYLNES